MPPEPAHLEAVLRVGSFMAVFAVMALWELAAPRRAPVARRERWRGTLALLAGDVVVIRVLAPGAAVGVALAAEAGGWGLIPALGMPAWLALPAAVVLLDLAIYIQHVSFHAIPALWRLHRVHHADTEVDVTTGTRFHPVEILLSTAVKCAAVAAIGAPAVAVLAFEVLLNATAVFNHANVNIPARVDALLRLAVVTPDMHRVHHSIGYNESCSNFGFNLPWWDRLFGTYRAQPAIAHRDMVLGVDAFRGPGESGLGRLLLQPLRDTPGGYPINRRPPPPATGPALP